MFHSQTVYFSIFVVISIMLECNSESFLFQEPPKPLNVWMDPFPKPISFVRPRLYREKNFGQWCRNFTVDIHNQCPQASPFHWFVCCGEHNVECCMGIQTWTYVVFGSFFSAVTIIFVFFCMLHFNVVFPLPSVNESILSIEADKMRSFPHPANSPTCLHKEIQSTSTLLRFTTNSLVDSTVTSCVSCSDINLCPSLSYSGPHLEICSEKSDNEYNELQKNSVDVF